MMCGKTIPPREPKKNNYQNILESEYKKQKKEKPCTFCLSAASSRVISQEAKAVSEA